MLIAFVDPTAAALNVVCVFLLFVAWLNTYAGLKRGTPHKRIIIQLAVLLVVIAGILVIVSAWSLGMFT